MTDGAKAGLWFFESIDRVNRAILQTRDLETMMSSVLEIVLDIFGADRSWLITPPRDATSDLQIVEQARREWPGLSTTGARLPNPSLILDLHRALLASSGPRVYSESELLTTGLRHVMHVRSMMAMAIFPSGLPAYAFGLHQCSRAREWTHDELELFSEIGQRLAEALGTLVLMHELRVSENRLAAAETLAQIGCWEIDLATNRVTFSAEARRIFGYGPDVISTSGEDLRNQIHPDDYQRIVAGTREALLSGRIIDEEARVIRPDGETRIIHSRLHLITHADGKPRAFFATSQDVTKRRMEETSIRETEVRFRTFVDHATDTLLLLDRQARIIDVNRHACDTLGYTREELLGQSPGLFDPNSTPEFLKSLGARLDSEPMVTFESELRRKDGSTFPVEVRMRAFSDGERRFVALARDITDQKRGEANLRAREERFRHMIEHASDLISVIDRDWNFHFQSPAIKRMLGLDPEQTIGKFCLDFVHPDDIAPKSAALKEAFAKLGQLVTFEQRVRHANGEWRTFQTKAQMLPDESGLVLNSRDLTEARLLEEQLRQAQKMDAVGQLAGGVAHDFNNILAAILMQTELSIRHGLPADVKENLDQIKMAAERAAELTRQLLMFSRRQIMQPRDIDLNAQIANLGKMLQRLLGEHIELELGLESQPTMARVDPGMLDQLLMNLAINGRDAMPDGGRLEIRLRADAEEFSIQVSDTGVGIPQEILPRIFEPFFTTKEAGKGTGLGLATVFGIVQQHKGTIRVISEPGAGATFEVRIPRGSTGRPTEVAPATSTTAKNELILVVEDDPTLRRTTRRTLERAGYRAVEASNGLDAIGLWESLEEKPHLLLTDLVMPGMPGRGLANAFAREVQSCASCSQVAIRQRSQAERSLLTTSCRSQQLPTSC
ncbi:MAG: PAS domain S-box protein [Kofleriaceae bacterium]